MINEQVILLMTQTIWLIIYLLILRDYQDLGLSMLMYSVMTEAMGAGKWLKWWVYVLLSVFSFFNHVWKRYLEISAENKEAQKLYTVEVWRHSENNAHRAIVEVKLFGNRKEADAYCAEQESYNEDFYTKAYVYEHRIKNNVD